MKLPNNPFAKPDTAQKPLYMVPFWTLKQARMAALEIAQTYHLSFDRRRFVVSFPAFDLKFTSLGDRALDESRNVIDVAELDELLLNYKERINKDESRRQADNS